MKTRIRAWVTSLMACPLIAGASIPIFSKKDNAQPSALVPRGDLLRSVLEISETPLAQISGTGERIHWVRESELWSAVDLSSSVYLRPGAEIKKFSFVNSANVPVQNTGGAWNVLRRQDFWLQIKRGGEQYWVRNRHAQANPEAWDNALVFEATSLLLQPQQNANRICQVNAGTIVRLISFHGHYAKASACGGAGYMHLSKLLTKAHFAKKVRTRDKIWHAVSRVNTNEIISRDFRPIPFGEIMGFEIDPKLRFTKTLARVNVLQTRQERWARSEVKNLGFFWWNMNATEQPDASREKTRVKSHKMFSGKIFDAATSPINPLLKIISAQGIYLTRNGAQWEKVDDLGDENYPLFITRTGKIFVGPYISYDDGQTFKPYIRWERLFAALGARGHFSLSKMRISDIQILDENGEKIKLVVYVGSRATSVFSTDMGRTWAER